jgi:hypothetical protein
VKDACAIVRTAAKVADGVSGAIFIFIFFLVNSGGSVRNEFEGVYNL